MSLGDKIDRLADVIGQHKCLAIAVSGGLDSMVLAHIAQRRTQTALTIVHARSPAVPQAASARVQAHAARHGWKLVFIDAEELADPNYRDNPADRCFYCKSRLYGRIQSLTGLPIASGTNVDDLSDYRPGLQAAANYHVLHPYVDAGMDKADIYAAARAMELNELAMLPAQPCLASRIETGICVDEATLRFIETAETALNKLLPEANVLRCRITAQGVHVECDKPPEESERARIEQHLRTMCEADGRQFTGIRAYRRGSAFLRIAVKNDRNDRTAG